MYMHTHTCTDTTAKEYVFTFFYVIGSQLCSRQLSLNNTNEREKGESDRIHKHKSQKEAVKQAKHRYRKRLMLVHATLCVSIFARPNVLCILPCCVELRFVHSAFVTFEAKKRVSGIK